MPEIKIKTEFRTIEEIADRVGKRPRAATRMAVRGIIPAIKMGREWVMTEAAYIESITRRGLERVK
jgi:hypothetical protein